MCPHLLYRLFSVIDCHRYMYVSIIFLCVCMHGSVIYVWVCVCHLCRCHLSVLYLSLVYYWSIIYLSRLSTFSECLYTSIFSFPPFFPLFLHSFLPSFLSPSLPSFLLAAHCIWTSLLKVSWVITMLPLCSDGGRVESWFPAGETHSRRADLVMNAYEKL